ncbi:MAG TPA: hypothetical protein VGL57_12410 [Solirubrobacteraceae bacterium]|jgi:hypothetical protein
MGLLDDAIREHLELKRLRGADPSEVARDERAALGPLESEDGEAYGSAETDLESEGEADGYHEEAPAVEGADRNGGDADRSTGAEVPRSSEETMEVDMRTIIDADLEHDDVDLGLNGEAMAANAAAYGRGADRASSGWGVDSNSADWEAREQRRRLATRPVRAFSFGGGPSVEGSLP